MIAWQYQTLARGSLSRGYLAVASEQLLVAADLLRRSPQPLYTARLAEIAARRLLQGNDPRNAALASAAARRFRSERALVSLGTFAREVSATDAALAERLGSEGITEAARVVAGWDLARLGSAISDLLVAG